MASSLKEKRGVVRRCVDRAKNKFNVSVSEVGDNDDHNRALIGVATVSNDHSFVNSVLDKVLDQVENDAIGRADVIEHHIEIMTL